MTKIFGFVLVNLVLVQTSYSMKLENFLEQKNTNFEFEFKISYLHSLITNGTKCSRIIEYFLNRAYTFNPSLNALISFNPQAMTEAIKLDKFYEQNKSFNGRLHCIPVLIKDNIDVKGIPTTGGINALRNSIPSKDATAVRRLKRDGAIIIGKANMAQLAQGNDTSENGGLCNNPFDVNRACGASSTGSGAGISSAMAIIGIGTDTDGSVINPSTFNGLFGLRPEMAFPPTDGVLPLFERRDTIGPITKNLEDLVLTYSILNDDPRYFEEFKKEVNPSELKILVIKNFINSFDTVRPNYTFKFDPQVKKALDDTIAKFKELKVIVNEIELSKEDFEDFMQKMDEMGKDTCVFTCAKYSANKYFSDPNRFESDAPFKSYADLLASPLLTQSWKDFFTQVNFDNPEQLCNQNCLKYDQLKQNLRDSILKNPKLPEFDSLFLAASAVLPFRHDQKFEGNEQSSLMSISSLTGFSALTFPAAYSTPSSEYPDGLPMGMLLINKPDRLMSAFKLAKLIDQAKNLKKLPLSTPLLENINCANNPSNSAKTLRKDGFLFLIFLLFLIF